MSLLIYRKALKYPVLTNKLYTISDIINYSQVDAGRISSIGIQMTSIFTSPLQIVIGLLLLYYYIGISFLVGTGVLLVLLILTFYFSSVYEKVNDDLLKAKD